MEKSNKKIILQEYIKITSIINNIQNKIESYKKEIEDNIKTCKKGDELMYIDQFKNTLELLKNDSEIYNKYRKLKKKQSELYELLTNDVNDQKTDDVIENMKRKYENLITNEITSTN